MENIVIRDQKDDTTNFVFQNLYILPQSGMFDSMPYAMSLYKHNISWHHLIKAIDMYNRDEELLYNLIKNNIENENKLYTSTKDIYYFENIPDLIDRFNKRLLNIKSRSNNLLKLENEMIYIDSYEKDTIEIISLIKHYSEINNRDLKNEIDLYNLFELEDDISKDKEEILQNIFESSSVAFIYGPAGTGKTKMIEILAGALRSHNKCFVANTNTAVTNMKNRIGSIESSYFLTISNYIRNDLVECDILFVDECSMVSNTDMIKILKKQEYQAIILVGDIYQIESIKYGNWFQFCNRYFSNNVVYNLKGPHRTSDVDLMELWESVRFNNKKAINILSNQEYTQPLSKEIFDKSSSDEVILCLNYDGMYGINNINNMIK